MKIYKVSAGIWACHSTYDEREIPKKAGWWWHPGPKCTRERCRACERGVGAQWWAQDVVTASRLAKYASGKDREELERALSSATASRAVEADIDVPAPTGLEYYPFQRAGIAYAVSRPGTLIADEMGLGKGHPVDTCVLTPDGWRRVGDIRVGDKVIGSDGRATDVVGVYPRGRLAVFRVRFSDGSEVTVDAEHLWPVWEHNDWHRGKPYRVMATAELAGNLRDGAGNRRWRIPLTAPVQFGRTSELPLDPYLIGVLLADQTKHRSTVIFCTGDERVPEEVRAVLPDGIMLTHSDTADGVRQWRIVSEPKFAPNPVLDALRGLGLQGLRSHERFVPRPYLYASVEARIALLQGLMDTDGELRPDGHIEYTTTSPALAKDVQFVVESLGGTARMHVKFAPRYKYKGELRIGRSAYRLTLALPNGVQPARAFCDRYHGRSKYPPTRLIDAIIPAGEAEVVCLAVAAADHLYLTEHCIVTHNTVQALGVVNADGSARRILILCPATLKLNWAREAKRWLVRRMPITVIESRTIPIQCEGVIIANYEQFVGPPGIELVEWAKGVEWDVLICDEAHYLKNTKAQRTKIVLGGDGMPGIAESARRKLFLTGTPIMNRPIEIWGIAHALAPEVFSSFWAFAKRYCVAGANGFGWDFSGARNLDELQEKLRATCMIRRLKKDVLRELPPKRRQIIVLEADEKMREVVSREIEAYREIEARIAEAKADAALARVSGDAAAYERAVERLKGVAADFAEISKLRHKTALAKVPLVLDHVDSLLEEEGKVVVFAHHHDVIERIAEHYGDAAVVLTGETPQSERMEVVNRFQKDESVKVFVGSITAAGLGITLTAASTAVFAELDWVPANITQAEDRLHRIGQESSVLVQHLVLDGSLDANMAKAIVEKQEIVDKALDAAVDPKLPVAFRIPTPPKEYPQVGIEEKRCIVKKLLKLKTDDQVDAIIARKLAAFGDDMTDGQCWLARRIYEKYSNG